MEAGICMDSSGLSCVVCPNGMYKTSGNSWTACNACGGADFYCQNGIRYSRSSSSCTYRKSVLDKFNSDGTLPQTVIIDNQEDTNFAEKTVRDSQDVCGQASLESSLTTLQMILPASSVSKFTVLNSGNLPIHIHDIELPTWAVLFDNTKGTEVTDESQLALIAPAQGSLDVYVLVKSSMIPSEDLNETANFATTGIEVASEIINMLASQVMDTPAITSQTLALNLTVEVSEPSLSILPAENTWSMKIGSISRQTLALYNMQVKTIDWEAEIVYNSGTETGWLSLNPLSGSLTQSFECTNDGEVISTDGVNKEEIVATINGSSIEPGSYTAIIKFKQAESDGVFSVTSSIKLEVLPGDVDASNTIYEWQTTSMVSESSEVTGDARRRLTEGTTNQIYLPYSSITIVPRDRFGIDSNQFADDVEEYFLVTWYGLTANSTSSGTLSIARNPIDNTFVGDLDIRQKGTYYVSITMGGNSTHIQGSPLTLDVLARDCRATANSEPHPVSGYTCVCSAGYGKTTESQVCEVCPAGQHRDESMLTVSPFCSTCDQGTYQDETGSSKCKYCPLGHQPNADQTACDACQDNYIVDQSSPSRNCVPCGNDYTVVDYECVCKPEFYWTDATKTSCTPCPAGAFCGYGDNSTILPLQGYWRTNWDVLNFEACLITEACLGVTSEDEYILRIPEAWAKFIANPNNETRVSGSTSSSSSSSSTRLRRQRILEGDARFLQTTTTNAKQEDYITRELYNTSSDDEGEGDELILPPVQQMNGCAEGLTGPLCNECAPGYYPLSTETACGTCDSFVSTLVFLLLSMIFGFAAVGYLIVRTIRARGAPRRREVMVLKIVLSHLQIIAMARRFPLEWPPAMISMFKIFDVLSSAGSSALSTHCLLSPTATNQSNPSIPFPLVTDSSNATDWGVENDYGVSEWAFLAESLTYALIPIILAAIFALWWTFIVPLYRDTSEDPLAPKEKSTVSIVVLLLVLQPFLTRAGFQFFSCSDDIDGRSFLEAQFTIQCWVGTHQQWVVLGALMLTIYAAGIPLYATFILYCVVRKRGRNFVQNLVVDAGKNSPRVLCKKQSLISAKSASSNKSGSASHLPIQRKSADKYDVNLQKFIDEQLQETRRQEQDEEDRARELELEQLRYRREREEIDSLEKWRPVYGFIYSGYRKECFFWEIIIMIRKACFATISVIFRPVGVDIQTYMGLLVLVVSITLHIQYRPYSAVSNLHIVETLSLGICFVTLMGGMLIFSPNTMLLFKQICTVLIIALNVFFLLFVAYSIRESLKESAVKLYERSRSVILYRSSRKSRDSQPSSSRKKRFRWTPSQNSHEESHDIKRKNGSRKNFETRKTIDSTPSLIEQDSLRGLVLMSEIALNDLEEGEECQPCDAKADHASVNFSRHMQSLGETGKAISIELEGSKQKTKCLQTSLPYKKETRSRNTFSDTEYSASDGEDYTDDDEDDILAEYQGDRRQRRETAIDELEVAPEVEHCMGLSYRLQREAERHQRQGNYEVAARTALLAARTALEALLTDAGSGGKPSRPASLASARPRPISTSSRPTIMSSNSSRPASLSSTTSAIVGTLMRNLPTYSRNSSDPSFGATRREVDNLEALARSPPEKHDEVDESEMVMEVSEEDLPPRLHVTSSSHAVANM